MGTLRRIKPGEPITAEFLNEIATRLERAASLSVAQPGYLRMIDGPDGKHLTLPLPRPIWAKLSGSTSPYSFVEMQPGPGGTWATLGNRAGSNAYEINNVAGLNNKIVQMVWTSAGDWRFNFRRTGCTCTADSSHVCICTCCTPWPKTMYVTDGLGTHAMVWNGFNWFVQGFYGGFSPQDNSFPAGNCLPCTGPVPLKVEYRLTPTCGSPATLTLAVGCLAATCITSGVSAWHYSCWAGSIIWSASNTITLPCDFSLISFNIPTTIAGTGTPPLATPGGGGALDVTP